MLLWDQRKKRITFDNDGGGPIQGQQNFFWQYFEPSFSREHKSIHRIVTKGSFMCECGVPSSEIAPSVHVDTVDIKAAPQFDGNRT